MVPITSLSERLMRGPSGNFSGLRAFVAGATGGTGRAIVARLSAEGIPVRALVRDVGAAVRSTFCTPLPIVLQQASSTQYASLLTAGLCTTIALIPQPTSRALL